MVPNSGSFFETFSISIYELPGVGFLQAGLLPLGGLLLTHEIMLLAIIHLAGDFC